MRPPSFVTRALARLTIAALVALAAVGLGGRLVEQQPLHLASPREPQAERRLFDQLLAAGQSLDGEVAATLYGPSPVPVAWTGRPVELPDARIAGPKAVFLVPDAQGLRLVQVQPLNDPVDGLRVGTLVLDCDFRHPAVLARELATIDLLSEGRLEVGLGAGWKNLDYERSGIPMDRPGARVDRMIEHTAVLKGMFSPGPFSFAGEHYRIDELDGTPAPFREGGPPILIGGGAPRVLRFAGATADIVGVNASVLSGEIDVDAAQDAAADRIDRKIEWIREGAGDRFDDLEFNAWLAVVELTALESAGVIFMEENGDGPGVKLRKRPADEGLRPDQLSAENDG